MPGSCDSGQGSSNKLSSLRTFRLANRAKPNSSTITPALRSSAPLATSATNSNSVPALKTTTPVRPIPAPTVSAQSHNPLSYRKYENSFEAQSLIKSISSKIQTLCKTNSRVFELKLSLPENEQFKEIISRDPALSINWAACVLELKSSELGERVYQIKKSYLWDLYKNITTLLNSKFPVVRSAQSGIRTYSRALASPQAAVSQNSFNSSHLSSDSSTPGVMDDYEEFCEKEQALRKLLDTFPEVDIMEAQDILVGCNWNLKEALAKAHKLPLKPSKKRGIGGSLINTSGNSANGQDTMPSSEEVVVLDSSDEEVDGKSKSNDISNGPPPAKRARRPISTSSSEDEAIAKARVSALPQVQQLPASVSNPPKSTASSEQGLNTSISSGTNSGLSKSASTAGSKPAALSVSAAVAPAGVESGPKPPHVKATPPAAVQAAPKPSPKQESAQIEKAINIPQGLSMKPVPTSSSETVPKPTATKTNPSAASSKSEPAAAPMPNLPKWLVVTQVGNENSAKDNGSAMNGSSDPVPSGSNKSAQLVKLKASSSVSATPVSDVPPKLPSGLSVSCTPVSQNVSITPFSKSVSISPVSSTPNASQGMSKLTVTPVGDNEESSQGKSYDGSTTDEEEEETEEKQKPKKSRIQNKMSLLDSDEHKEHSVEQARENKKREKGSSKRKKKLKRYDSDDDEDGDYGNDDIYDSEDSDCGENTRLTPAHSAVLKFFQESTPEELGSVPGCSKKKIEAILKLRPFSSWADLVEKLKNDKALSTDLLNGVKKVLDMRNAISKLMAKCQRISLDMEDLVESLKENKESSTDYVAQQPELLNERMHLTGYQMLGLNWLLLMHNQEVNGILADEMGLGKTVQAIAFLAYLKQIEEYGPHLVVVPSSTMDNWKKEFETWWPSVSLICYHGGQESRRELRLQILNDEVDEFDIMITTYNMVCSSTEDRGFFKRIEFNYVIFDEAHMLKNMSSQRYNNLMRVKAARRLLLTGTPLQNNLVELMSLLIFAMPHMFSGKTEQIKQMFSSVSKTEGNKGTYERDRIEHAKRIMKPFVLRRLKKDVLKELPAKTDETKYCPMVEDQEEKYKSLVEKFSAEVQESQEGTQTSSSGIGMMMQLRRAANHPLLLRRIYNDEKLSVMSKKIIKEPTHSNSDPNLVFEDMSYMSDFELHKLCKQYKTLKSFVLPNDVILNSGKFKVLDELLPEIIKGDHRVLLFSQFTMVLDIIEEYMEIRKYKFLRLDGQVPVQERQQLIDEFNNDPEILVFLLSTRAGGLGINLTAADTVILHDIDFNPYNDKQAEDRCHRVGQVRDVKVIRLVSKNTIEEGILQRATEKLNLEKDIHEEDTEENDSTSVVMLLREALGIKPCSKS